MNQLISKFNFKKFTSHIEVCFCARVLAGGGCLYLVNSHVGNFGIALIYLKVAYYDIYQSITSPINY